MLAEHRMSTSTRPTPTATPRCTAPSTTATTRIIQYLFEKGANLNAKDKNGWTPLNIAEIYRNNFREHKESAALLRKLGASRAVPPPKKGY